MKPIATSRRPVALALLAGVATISGCSEELGPVPMPVARVKGVAKEGDRPLSGGWIEFTPTDGTIGNLRSARLRPDGSFEADGVAVGTNAIRFVNARIEAVPYRRIFTASFSPIRRVINAGVVNSITIRLDEEAIRFQRERSRPAAGTSTASGGRP